MSSFKLYIEDIYTQESSVPTIEREFQFAFLNVGSAILPGTNGTQNVSISTTAYFSPEDKNRSLN